MYCYGCSQGNEFSAQYKKYVNVNIRSRERMVQRTNGSRNECSRERMVPRMKVPSWERMLQGTNSLGNEYSSILWNHQITLLVDVFPLIIILWMDSFWAAMAEWLRCFTSTWQTWFETCCRPYGSGSPGKWPLKWRGREREKEREREREMPVLSLNQQCQSTESSWNSVKLLLKYFLWFLQHAVGVYNPCDDNSTL